MASVVTYFVFGTGLGAVCLLAGLEKARAPRDFFEGVRQYRLVPRRLAPVVGGGLIAAELGLGALRRPALPVPATLGARPVNASERDQLHGVVVTGHE